MALQVNLTLSKTYFLPGELVQVCVQIFNETENVVHETGRSPAVPEVLHIKELSFQANGTERTDPSFIHRLHHPEVPVDITDSRKCIRSIFATESAMLIRDKVLAPHAVRSFQLRFRLPSALPPTFRGSAVRFLYMMHVKAVYEVQRGTLDAMVFETTASTTLTVWPSLNVPIGMPLSSTSSLDRRPASRDYSIRGLGVGLGDVAGSDSLPLLQDRSSKAVDVGDAGKKAEAGHLRLSGAGGGSVSSPSGVGVPLHAASSGLNTGSAHGGLGSAAGEDGDVPMCDYVLGRNCRIRCQDIGGGDSTHCLLSCSSLWRSSSQAADGSLQKTGAGSAPPHRGVIPFGVNRPFDAPFPAHPHLTLDTDSDAENAQGCRASSGNGLAAVLDASSNGCLAPAEPLPHVQRQLSGGAGGLATFTRHPSRRNSLFGKVYALNVGDQPLLRLLLHAPLEVPLHPGATFSGVLDFRQLQATLSSSALACPRSMEPLPITCYSVTILLETEEVLSPECRPQRKRDGGAAPTGSSYVIRRLHAEHHDLTGDTALTSFIFSMPSTATPSFRTPMVSLRWVLRFELIVGPKIIFTSVDNRVRPLRPQLEQLVWSLPLNLRPPVATAR